MTLQKSQHFLPQKLVKKTHFALHIQLDQIVILDKLILSWAWNELNNKISKPHDLVLNPCHGIRKSKIKIWCVHNVNAKGLYYKTMTRIEQDHDKNTFQNLMLNKLKVMWDFTSIYTHKTHSSRTLLKKLPTYMWPMCTHVWPMFVHVWTNNELWIN